MPPHHLLPDYYRIIMLQKIGFQPGINKQITDTGQRDNGQTVIMSDFVMVFQKK